MNPTVFDVVNLLEAWAPAATAEAWDNVGLQVGRWESAINTVLISLDVDESVLAHAREIGAGLIISHHPVLFRPVVAVDDHTLAGRLVLGAAEGGVALFAAHTNLDRAAGGVNDALCDALGLQAMQVGGEQIGRLAQLDEAIPLGDWAALVRSRLAAHTVRVTGAADRRVQRVYVLSGAGRSEIDAALACNADVLLTGELGYHDAQKALYAGLSVVEAGHYETEAPVLRTIEKHLQMEFQRLQYKIRTVVWEQSTCPFWYVCGH